MSAGFTPGPWLAAEGEGRVYRYANTDEHTARIETVSRGSSVANARLIAAAPTMAAYIQRKADEGDAEAAAIMEAVHGRS